ALTCKQNCNKYNILSRMFFKRIQPYLLITLALIGQCCNSFCLAQQSYPYQNSGFSQPNNNHYYPQVNPNQAFAQPNNNQPFAPANTNQPFPQANSFQPYQPGQDLKLAPSPGQIEEAANL